MRLYRVAIGQGKLLTGILVAQTSGDGISESASTADTNSGVFELMYLVAQHAPCAIQD